MTNHVQTPIKTILHEGKTIIGTMLIQARAPAFIQLFAAFGLEFVIIDMEHGSYNLETAADLIQVARLAGITSLVRLGEVQYTLYSRALDAGAQGIVTPRVESASTVQDILRFTRYPPEGERGFSPLGAHGDYNIGPGLPGPSSQEFVRRANRDLLNIIMIETRRGLENIDSILSISGIDGVLVGLQDLALSLGLAGDTTHPEVEAALERIMTACQHHSTPWGLHIPEARRLAGWIKRGMQIACFSTDIWMIQQVLRDALPILRDAIR